MKNIDFTQPGGFPLTQDQLGYLQESYTECLGALASVGGAGPMVISGMDITKTLVSGSTYNYVYTDGWVLYNNSLIKVPSGSLAGINESINDAYIAISTVSAPLTFNDGSTPNVIKETKGSMIAQTIGTAEDASHFLVKNFQKYGRENAENHLVISTPAIDGGVAGDIYYRKNLLNNTLQIRGFLGANNAQNLASSSIIQSYLIGTIPEQYRPVSARVYFNADVKFILTTRIKDDLGIGWIDRVVCELHPTGGIYMFLPKPEIAIAAYPLEIYTILPLD